MQVIEAIFVITLFLTYIILWRVKKAKQVKATGTDPEVMAVSKSAVQTYMNVLTRVMTLYAVVIIILHSLQIQYGSMFNRVAFLNNTAVDITGFALGLAGLSVCLYAQTKMGSSWRVGIDEKVKTELVTTGLYKYIRNPTYLGLFLLNVGIWLIWPTWTVFILNLVFILFLEIQVRCEEDHLTATHGATYDEYKKKTKRYFPFIY